MSLWETMKRIFRTRRELKERESAYQQERERLLRVARRAKLDQAFLEVERDMVKPKQTQRR